MNKAIKYRLYPTTEQEMMFAKTFGCCRKVYNLMLADKISCYQETKSFGKQTPAMYKTEFPFLKEVDSLALANVQLNLQSAMKNCFDKSRKRQNGFPKFKSAKHSRKSYTTNNQKGTVAILADKYIRLPKIGLVKAVTPVIISNNVIGLDYKSDGLYMDSNGYHPSGHKYYRRNQRKLAHAQRKLKHMVTGSNNYRKQQRRIAKIQKHTSNQRLDFLHKESTKIANLYDLVCVESLDMKAMANKGFGNGKATMDNGYGMFLNMLEYKLTDRGKYFIKVDKWYPSSQLCSCCGRQKKLTLADRIYKCDCGLSINRDLNAAINIRNEGLRILKSA